MRRTQIYLDDRQTASLDVRAAGEGVTRSTVIRRAVDEYLARDNRDSGEWKRRWRDAVAKTAGIAPDLPDGAAYVERLRAADAERLREIGL
jgi:Ribbon-helix-helix protein, copG family